MALTSEEERHKLCNDYLCLRSHDLPFSSLSGLPAKGMIFHKRLLQTLCQILQLLPRRTAAMALTAYQIIMQATCLSAYQCLRVSALTMPLMRSMLCTRVALAQIQNLATSSQASERFRGLKLLQSLPWLRAHLVSMM